MIYDLKRPIDKAKAEATFKKHLEKGSTIELKRKVNRTLSQNSYLHVILTYFSMEYGSNLEYTKQELFKKLVNEEIFKQEKRVITNETITQYRSTADLDTAEMTKAIDKFRNWSGANGIYLPEPHEEEFLAHVQIEASRNNYL